MTEDTTTDTAAPMRLRTEPPRVTRLSRKMLAGVGAVALLGIGGALIYALQTRDMSGNGEELYSTENRPTADGLSGLPRDYTGPVLGPALPGDLGGPILDAQNRGQPVAPPVMVTPAVDPEEQRRLAEEEAARLSRVFFQTAPGTGTAAGGASPSLAGLGLGTQPGAVGTQDRHTAFLNGPVDRQTVALDRIMAPASPYILQAGAVIPAAMITGVRSDLPGQITAQVTENVYDSPTGSLLLIPQGTRIIGQYDAGVTFGQRRVLLVWNRLILPNGRSIVLERQPGADAAGYAGLEDGVDLSLVGSDEGGRPVHAARHRHRTGDRRRGPADPRHPRRGAGHHQSGRTADRPAPVAGRADADHSAGLSGEGHRDARFSA